MRTTIFLAVIVSCSVCLAPTRSAPQERQEGRVNLEFTNVPLHSALDRVFRGSVLKHSIDGDVPRVPITLKASDLPLETALRLVLWMGHAQIPGLTYEFDGQTYRIGIREPGEPFLRQSMVAKPDATEISLDVNSAPLRQVLALIFKDTDTSYAIASDVRDVPVTIKVQDLAVDPAVRLVVRLANAQIGGLRVTREGSAYMFILAAPPALGPNAFGFPFPPRRAEEALQQKVNLRLQETPLRTALDLVFQGTGLQYAVEPNVPNVPISVNVRDLSVRAALRLVVRLAAAQVPGLTFARQDGVYIIRIRQEQPAEAEGEGPPNFEIDLEHVQWEKIQLHYLDVLDVENELRGVLLPDRAEADEPREAFMFTEGSLMDMWPDGLEGVIGFRRDNSLLALGTPEAVQELKNLMRVIDVPHRRFHLRLSTGALRAEGQASEFVPFKLSDAAADQQIEATLTPRLLGDGNVEVHVSVKLTVGSVSRRLETSVIARPGKTVTVGTLGVGKRRVVIRLNAKTFEPKPAWLPVKKNR